MTNPSTPTSDSAGWIEWTGGECPVAPDAPIRLRYRDGSTGYGDRAGFPRWDHRGNGSDIIAYRLSDRLADEGALGVAQVPPKFCPHGVSYNSCGRCMVCDAAKDGRSAARRMIDSAKAASEQVRDQSAVAGAIETFWQLVGLSDDDLARSLKQYTRAPIFKAALRMVLADHAAQALRIKALGAVIERSIDEMEGVHSDLTASLLAWAWRPASTLKRVMADLHDILLGSTEGRDDG